MEDDNILSGLHAASLAVPPMFPATINVGGASIKLHPDGTWSGDGEKFISALQLAKRDGTTVTMLTLWLVANAIRNSKT